MKPIHSIIFVVLASIFVLTSTLGSYPQFLPSSWLMKILPLLTLILLTLKLKQSRYHSLFLVGLIFSALGDFFLDYDHVNWFVFGLGSFLFAHIFYIMSLKPLSSELTKKHLKIIAVYCVYGLAMFSLISSGLGELFIPVLLYMSVLLFMAIATLVSDKSNSWLIIGGISFVLSDSLLGINKFYVAIPNASVLIMISYYFAQYSLTRGMFKKLN